MSDCGTYAGYQAHTRRKEQPCESCRLANNTYLEGWRQTEPGRARLARDNMQKRARHRALVELSRRHYVEFLTILRRYQTDDEAAS